MDYRNHLQAWLTFAAKAKRRSGRGEKPVYSKFSRFYDYEKQLEKAKNGNKQSCFSGIGRLLRKER